MSEQVTPWYELLLVGVAFCSIFGVPAVAVFCYVRLFSTPESSSESGRDRTT